VAAAQGPGMRWGVSIIRPASARHAEAGFTLVELIVASTLMTLVLGGVYFTFSTAVRSWRQAEAGTEGYQQGRRAIGLLQRELRGIPQDALHLFDGSAEEVSFVTVGRPLDVETGEAEVLIFVSYFVDRDRGIAYLRREEAPVEGPLPAERPPSEDLSPLKLGRRSVFTLASGVVDFRLGYTWMLRQPSPGPNLPPRPAYPVREREARRVVPDLVDVELDLIPLDDPGSTPIPFATTIVFRGPTSPVPYHLIMQRGGP